MKSRIYIRRNLQKDYCVLFSNTHQIDRPHTGGEPGQIEHYRSRPVPLAANRISPQFELTSGSESNSIRTFESKLLCTRQANCPNGLRIAPVEADPITELNSELAATTNNSRCANSKSLIRTSIILRPIKASDFELVALSRCANVKRTIKTTAKLIRKATARHRTALRAIERPTASQHNGSPDTRQRTA